MQGYNRTRLAKPLRAHSIGQVQLVTSQLDVTAAGEQLVHAMQEGRILSLRRVRLRLCQMFFFQFPSQKRHKGRHSWWHTCCSLSSLLCVITTDQKCLLTVGTSAANQRRCLSQRTCRRRVSAAATGCPTGYVSNFPNCICVPTEPRKDGPKQLYVLFISATSLRHVQLVGEKWLACSRCSAVRAVV